MVKESLSSTSFGPRTTLLISTLYGRPYKKVVVTVEVAPVAEVGRMIVTFGFVDGVVIGVHAIGATSAPGESCAKMRATRMRRRNPKTASTAIEVASLTPAGFPNDAT